MATGSCNGPAPMPRWRVSISFARGISCQAVRSRPMVTDTSLSPFILHLSTPPSVRSETDWVSRSFISSQPIQREALPQASTSRPSVLKIRTKAATPFPLSEAKGASTISNSSPPTPSLRSQIRLISEREGENRVCRASTMMISFRRPCIFING